LVGRLARKREMRLLRGKDEQMRGRDEKTTMEDEILDEIEMARVDVGEVVPEEVENGRTGGTDEADTRPSIVISNTLLTALHLYELMSISQPR
jgi:hypothetical protein